MRNIAIIEDREGDFNVLSDCIKQYEVQTHEKFSVFHFKDGEDFLDGYKPIYDLVFMDIELPMMSGMTAAVKLRALDPVVQIVFVTNLAQYAIKGYEVDAVDFIVKPYSYEVFARKFARALKRAPLGGNDRFFVKTENGVRLLMRSEILYVDVIGHYIYYHTLSDVIRCRGSLLNLIEQPFFQIGFAYCNKCYLVNLGQVRKVEGFDLYVGDEILKISRPKKNKFMAELSAFYANGGGNRR